MALIDQAVAWAIPRFEGQQALTGEPLASHGAGVVRILAALHTDAATRAAALLAAFTASALLGCSHSMRVT
ncbi:hypothetical protein G6F35_017964 [Rhizopus arrhizus]|nr:hypothetical protein G6F35_017964 [Rhizopus arrhizus]